MAAPADTGQTPEPPRVPPDSDAYDAPRAVQARARGLAAPYIAGGEDPDMAATRRRERRYLRLLVAMVVVVVLAGFVLGAIAKLVEDAIGGPPLPTLGAALMGPAVLLTSFGRHL
jgi:hypothetical protein